MGDDIRGRTKPMFSTMPPLPLPLSSTGYGTGFASLRHEITFFIFSRLSVKTLCCFKSVSKPWLALITDPEFIKSHLNHQSTKDNKTQKLILTSRFSYDFYSVEYQSPDPTIAKLKLPFKPSDRILVSLNGILFLRTGKTLQLGSPLLRRFQKFSQPREYPGGYVMYVLGYDSVRDDYKVVRAIRPSRKNVPCDVQVFSSKYRSWDRIDDFGYMFYVWRPGMVLNGAPHWVVGRFGLGMGSVIVYFDAIEEKFKEIPSPEGEDILVDWRVVHLGVFDGCLCVVKYHREGHADVWVMKEYGAKESWTKLLVLPNNPGVFFPHLQKPLCHASNGEVVMVWYTEKLVSYDLKECSYKTIDIGLVNMRFETFGMTICGESCFTSWSNGTKRHP